MRCSSCQHDNPAGARFCIACGARLAATCAACAASLPDGARFCPQCGSAAAPGEHPAAGTPPTPGAPGGRAATTALPLTPAPTAYTPPHLTAKILGSRAALEGERKPVTVLFCDVAGSTALAERLGPDAMHDLLNRFFAHALAEVHRYEGTVNQFLGDGFMALFGAPVAHEDHARRAALAALAIRRALAERPLALDAGPAVTLTLRMGLHTGIVVVGVIGDNLRMDYTAVGDTTHLAARLQQLAAPGEILLSEATARAVESHASLERCGPTAIRGFQAPVAVCRLTGERSSRGMEAWRRRVAFVGRVREKATLEELLERTRSEGRGHAVGIVGEPGAGKSRLLGELREAVGEGAVTWLEGRCLSHGRAIPYLPALDVLRAQCGIADLDAPEHMAEKVRATLARFGLDPAERSGCLLAALGVKDDAAIAPGADGEGLMTRTFDTMRQLLLRESRRRPVVLVAEDLHWIDPTSEAYLATVADSLAGAPILLLATYRPGHRPGWLDRSWASQLSLAPLGPSDSLEVLRAVAPGLAPDDLRARAILARAEGNPFFLEELARAVEDEAAARAVPDTIQAVLAARIDRLPPRLKHLLQVASVLGREFPARLLALVDDEDGAGRVSALEAELGELARLEFVHERGDREEPTWMFKHALTQEGAQATLVAARRRELHRRAAEALVALHPDRIAELAPRLADHYAEAGVWTGALVHARRAAERARAAYANREALARYEQALLAAERAGAGAGERRELLEARATVHALLGSFDAARVDLEAALGTAEARDDVAARGRILGALAALWGGHRDYQRGLEFARQAVDLLVGRDDARALAEARTRLGTMLLNLGRLGEGRRQLEEALSLMRALGDEAGQARAVDILAMCLGQAGESGRAIACAEEAIRRLRAIGDREAESSALVTLGFTRMFQGGWRAGAEHLGQAMEVADAIGAHAASAFARTAQAEMAVHFGRVALALRASSEGLARARAIGHQEWIVHALGSLGCALAACGDRAGGRRAHEEMVTLSRRLGTTIWASKSLGHLAEDLIDAGEDARAARCIAESIEVAGEAVEPASRALQLEIEMASRRGRPEEALALAARARDRLVGLGAALAAAVDVAESEALVALGRIGEAERKLRLAQATAEATDMRPLIWRAGLALCRILRETGRRGEARAAADRALASLEMAAAEIEDPARRRSFEATPPFLEARQSIAGLSG